MIYLNALDMMPSPRRKKSPLNSSLALVGAMVVCCAGKSDFNVLFNQDKKGNLSFVGFEFDKEIRIDSGMICNSGNELVFRINHKFQTIKDEPVFSVWGQNFVQGERYCFELYSSGNKFKACEIAAPFQYPQDENSGE